MHLTCHRTLQAAFHACHIWAMDILCHCNVGLLFLWILRPAIHLEVSVWPILIIRKIRKWLEGAEGIFRQVRKGITSSPKPSYCLFFHRSLRFFITQKMAQPLLPPHPARPLPLLPYPFIKQQSQRTGPLWWHHSRQWDHICFISFIYLSVYFKAGNSVIIQR